MGAQVLTGIMGLIEVGVKVVLEYNRAVVVIVEE